MKKLISIFTALTFMVLLTMPVYAEWGGRVWHPKATKSAAPTVNDDTWPVYTVWVDETADKAYICIDNTPGAAVWKQITGGGDSGGTISTDTTLTSDDFNKIYVVDADCSILLPTPSSSYDGNWFRFYKKVDGGVSPYITAGSFQESGTTIANHADNDGWLECLYSGTSVFIYGYGTWTRSN